MKCAECGNEITEEYLTIKDNFLKVKYFDYIDGSDNVFCSTKCLENALSVETIHLDKGDK